MSSPFTVSAVLVGLNEIPIWLAEIIPLENALSVTVGTRLPLAGERVPGGSHVNIYGEINGRPRTLSKINRSNSKRILR